MKRRLFTILSALSLVVGLLLLLLWPRSYWIQDQWYVIFPEHNVYCYSNRGSVTFDTCTHHSGDFSVAWNSREPGEDFYAQIAPNVPALEGIRLSIFGIGFIWCPVIGPEPGYTNFTLLRLPYPWLLPIVAVAPVFWLRGFQKRRHQQHLLLCKKCGYDLRASIDRCPECGTAFT